MKYRLANKCGNRVIETDSEKNKDQLLQRGFHIYGEEKNIKQVPTAKRRKAVKKDARKTSDKD